MPDLTVFTKNWEKNKLPITGENGDILGYKKVNILHKKVYDTFYRFIHTTYFSSYPSK